METYHFHLHQKVTTWEKVTFSIEAETEEQAIEMAKHYMHDPDDYPEDGECEVLFELTHYLSRKENNGDVTRQLFMDGESLPIDEN